VREAASLHTYEMAKCLLAFQAGDYHNEEASQKQRRRAETGAIRIAMGLDDLAILGRAFSRKKG
jgi:hypothetical protein